LDELLNRAIGFILTSIFVVESKGAIFLVEDGPGVLVLRAQKGGPESLKKACARVPFGKCICGRAALHQKIEFVDCIEDRHETLYEGITPHGHYCVPIMAADEILGVLNLYVEEGHRRDKKDEEFLSAVADTLAGIILRKQAEQALQKVNRALKTLSDCNQALIRATEEMDLMNEVCRIIVQVGGYRLAWVGFAEQDEKKTVRPVAHVGDEDGYLDTVNITWADTEQGRGPTGTAIRTGKVTITKNILKDPEYTPWHSDATKRGYKSSIALPIIAEDLTLGALNVYSAEPDAFAAEEVKLLTELADDMAHGIVALRTQTERERAQEALKELQRYTRGLIEASLDALVTISAEGKITDVNHAMELFTGLSRNEMIGTGFSNYCTDPELARKGYQQVFRDGYIRDYPLEIKHHGGKITPVLYNASVYNDTQGRVSGVFAAARDVTERNRAEKEKISLEAAVQAAEMANRAKSDFLASMSHELRTPLNAIIGFSEVLRDQYFGRLNEKQAEYATDILDSGKHLLSLINDILDLSKVEAGKMEIELSRVNIRDLLGNSMIMVKEKAHKHGINLDVDISNGIKDLVIRADERKLKQVMFNLLSNAVKFTPEGGNVHVSARIVDCRSAAGQLEKGGKSDRGSLLFTGQSQCIEVSVADTGIGIEPGQQARIFEEFYQVQGGRTDKTPGTGLGLPLTKQLIEMQGGAIWVESEGEGKGARFCFLLPTEPGHLGGNAHEEPARSPHGMESGKLFLNHLKRTVSFCKRHNSSFILCHFQADTRRFKEAGHKIRVAVENEIRRYDFWGESEHEGIYLILQETDRNGAKTVCDRLAKKLGGMLDGEKAPYAVAVFPEDGESADALLRKVEIGKD
ncbi:MAG: GAF domain-containing protein, partial [Deltaproteobacteria bacterium]|nr:GAF domain-containing protein [Deltaproteobacteria bacterium]